MQQLGEQLGDPSVLELAAFHQGDLLRRRGDYELAVQRLESAASYAPEATDAVEGLRQQTLARAHAENGQRDAFGRAIEVAEVRLASCNPMSVTGAASLA